MTPLLDDHFCDEPTVQPSQSEQRLMDWNADLKPVGVSQEFLVQEISESTAETQRFRAMLKMRQDQLAQRLETDWDDEMRMAVERIVVELDYNPPLAVQKLMMTPHGCDWMIDAWRRIAAYLEDKQKLTDIEWTVGLNLLGTPKAIRNHSKIWNATTNVTKTAAAQIAALEDRKASRLPFDARDRQNAISGQSLAFAETDEIKAIRKELAASEKRMKWAWSRLKESQREARKLAKTSVPQPVMEVTPVEVVKPVETPLKLSTPVRVGPALVDALPVEEPVKLAKPELPAVPTSAQIQPGVVVQSAEVKWVGAGPIGTNVPRTT